MTINSVILTLLYAILLFSAGMVAYYLIQLLDFLLGKRTLEQINLILKTKKEITQAVVLFVEQVYKEKKGNEKLQLAIHYIVNLFEYYGLSIDEKEVHALIEATIREFKTKFGEAWENKVKNN